MSRRPWAAGLGLAFGLLGASTGCDFESAAPIYGPRNTCTSTSDCRVGTCMEGICVSTESEPLELAISVASPSGVPVDEGFAYTLDDVVIDGSTILSLEVPVHARVHGRVTVAGVPVSAQVSAVRRVPSGLVLGLDARTSRTSTDLPIAADGLPDHYGVRIARDEDYLLYAEPVGLAASLSPGTPSTPLSAILPPLLLETFRAATYAPGADEVRVDLTYPASLVDACSAQKLEGCTLSGSVVLVDTTGQPVAIPAGSGFEVRAFLPERGLAVSSSSTTTIDGKWSVRITPGVTAFDLVLEGLHGTGLPKVRVSSADLVFNSGVVEIVFPYVEPVPYVAIVESGQGTPLANASVSLVSTSLADAPAGLDVTVDSLVVTGDGSDGKRVGQFSTQLWPGVYDVVVTPADAGEGSSLRTSLTVRRPPTGGALLGQLFRVPKPVSISGYAMTAGGAAAPYVGLSALPQSTYDFSHVLVGTMRAPTVGATADATGLFELEVDSARYDLLLTANIDSGYGAVLVPGLDLWSGTALGDVEIVLPPPLLVRGDITLGGLAPDFSEGLVLSAFLVLRADGPTRLAPIGQFVSEPDGTYRMLISPR